MPIKGHGELHVFPEKYTNGKLYLFWEHGSKTVQRSVIYTHKNTS